MTHKLSVSLLGLFGACTAGGSDRLEISQPNALGATAFERAHSSSDGGEHFELIALDAADREVARVALRTGEVPALQTRLPGADTLGSEIVLTTAGNQQRVISREVSFHVLQMIDEPALRELMTLPTVATILADEAHILVQASAPMERAYSTQSCPSSYMLQTPTAAQCCFYSMYSTSGTMFVTPAGDVSNRVGPATPCTAFGGGSCSGADCYYGPQGFARAQFSNNGQYPSIYSDAFGGCGADNQHSSEFGDVYGDSPNNQGCPGGGTGAGQWDY